MTNHQPIDQAPPGWSASDSSASGIETATDRPPPPPISNRCHQASAATAYMSDRGATGHLPTVSVFLAPDDRHLRLEVAGATLDDRNVGATALLTRGELQEVINALVMARERWDQHIQRAAQK